MTADTLFAPGFTSRLPWSKRSKLRAAIFSLAFDEAMEDYRSGVPAKSITPGALFCLDYIACSGDPEYSHLKDVARKLLCRTTGGVLVYGEHAYYLDQM